tara:strand:- start:142 stop:261 length:120 start_codon:yes stop_codon:yes gene_type:complete
MDKRQELRRLEQLLEIAQGKSKKALVNRINILRLEIYKG